jgi:antitoxin YefM
MYLFTYKETAMRHASLSEFRANLASHLDRLEQDRDHLLVTRQGHEPVVVLPLSEWEGMEATLHLLSNPVNAQFLKDSIAELDAGRTVDIDPATMKPAA